MIHKSGGGAGRQAGRERGQPSKLKRVSTHRKPHIAVTPMMLSKAYLKKQISYSIMMGAKVDIYL